MTRQGRGVLPKEGFQHPVLGQSLLGAAGAVLLSQPSLLPRVLSQVWAVAGQQGTLHPGAFSRWLGLASVPCGL